jgi:hypothetical protein
VNAGLLIAASLLVWLVGPTVLAIVRLRRADI